MLRSTGNALTSWHSFSVRRHLERVRHTLREGLSPPPPSHRARTPWLTLHYHRATPLPLSAEHQAACSKQRHWHDPFPVCEGLPVMGTWLHLYPQQRHSHQFVIAMREQPAVLFC